MSELYQEDMSAWSEALSSQDGPTRQVAREQLVDMGPLVVPLLNRLLEDPDLRVAMDPLQEALDTKVEPEVVMTVASRLMQGMRTPPVPSSL